MDKAELEKFYLETTYSVFISQAKYDIKIGEPVPPIINQLLDSTKQKSAVILTAWNPRSKALSLEINTIRNKELRDFLNNSNYSIFDAVGKDHESSWTAEESFFVINIQKEAAELLAVTNEQNAYVWFESGKPASLEFTSIW